MRRTAGLQMLVRADKAGAGAEQKERKLRQDGSELRVAKEAAKLVHDDSAPSCTSLAEEEFSVPVADTVVQGLKNMSEKLGDAEYCVQRVAAVSARNIARRSHRRWRKS